MFAIAFLVAASSASYVGAVPLYGQCGGIGYEGDTFCDSGSVCEVLSESYSQCLPAASDPDRPGRWEQCGGIGYTGSPFCTSGLQCIWINASYSQCIPEGQLADLDEPCGPATADNKKCALQTRDSGPVFMKCSSTTDTDATCVLCGFRDLSCCPAGVFTPDRPPCQAAPRFTAEIPCNVEDDVCEGDVIDA